MGSSDKRTVIKLFQSETGEHSEEVRLCPTVDATHHKNTENLGYENEGLHEEIKQEQPKDNKNLDDSLKLSKSDEKTSDFIDKIELLEKLEQLSLLKTAHLKKHISHIQKAEAHKTQAFQADIEALKVRERHLKDLLQKSETLRSNQRRISKA